MSDAVMGHGMPTYLLKQVLRINVPQNAVLARLLHLSTQHQLIQHVVGFLKVEDDVEFTDLKERMHKPQLTKRVFYPLRIE